MPIGVTEQSPFLPSRDLTRRGFFVPIYYPIAVLEDSYCMLNVSLERSRRLFDLWQRSLTALLRKQDGFVAVDEDAVFEVQA